MFVQGFAAGDAAPLDAEKVRAAVGAMADDADVFFDDPGRGGMISRPTAEACEVIARLVVEADAVAFWPAVVLTAVVGREGREVDLPEEFERIVVVRTGADVVRAIEESDG